MNTEPERAAAERGRRRRAQSTHDRRVARLVAERRPLSADPRSSVERSSSCEKRIARTTVTAAMRARGTPWRAGRLHRGAAIIPRPRTAVNQSPSCQPASSRHSSSAVSGASGPTWNHALPSCEADVGDPDGARVASGRGPTARKRRQPVARLRAEAPDELDVRSPPTCQIEQPVPHLEHERPSSPSGVSWDRPRGADRRPADRGPGEGSTTAATSNPGRHAAFGHGGEGAAHGVAGPQDARVGDGGLLVVVLVREARAGA